ncbi:CHRD domain-containing protein [Flaviaesturariibacter flavus]|uniref:CHRD domain-containing protein n=1 Tax=Flaviaesturariibacter flavus TaxID=2502780 RepID=A0A4R1BJR0_9BACT|nr:CHRD domain-containing protein [Flaviaesturariibacter flavus]TCJ17438.1 CHRD domain-containing protein [Flaviaesturariibacter flavus]
MLKRLSFIAVSALVIAVSCKKSEEVVTYVGNGLPLNSNQVVPVPATPSPASGSLNATYDKNTRTLSYSVTWSNTNDSVTAIRLHGPAEPGFAGAIVQAFINSTSSQSVPPRRKTGSFSTSVSVDNVLVKEDDILNDLYYVAVYTKSSGAAPELRGQIRVRRAE